MKKIYFLFLIIFLIFFSGCLINVSEELNPEEKNVIEEDAEELEPLISVETIDEITTEESDILGGLEEEPTSGDMSIEEQNQTSSKRVFFVHHSTGEIYWNSGMRSALYSHGYTGDAPWWDGETNPQDFYREFNERWDSVKDYDIIIFKSCFPASDITSEEMLNDYKNWYKKLYEIYSSHPDKLFVPMSTPPLLKNHTTAVAARRALQFENWLLGEYKNMYSGKNLAPFALHSILDDNSGFLDERFMVSPEDDHPNDYSGSVVGEAMWKHLDSILNK